MPASQEGRRYRLLVRLDLAVSVEAKQPFPIYLDQQLPQVALRPAEDDRPAQAATGGTYLSVEFLADTPDLLKAAAIGFELI